MSTENWRDGKSDAELAPYRDEVVAQLHATRAENAKLVEQIAHLTRPVPHESEVAKARLALHASASAAIYGIACVATVDAYTPFSWTHPNAAIVLAGLNFFAWSLTSVIRKFG